MRNIACIIILFFLAACNAENAKNKPFIGIDAKVLRSFDTVQVYGDTVRTYEAFDIRITIKNKSKNPVSFWMMTCSWEESFIINNDYIHFIPHECDSNFPRIVRLDSNESFVLASTVLKLTATRYQNVNTTKFGFIYIDTLKGKDLMCYDDIIGDKSKYDTIIWSNALSLKHNE